MYSYDAALEIAQQLCEEIQPYCERVEIGGSIRRKKAQVKDIELVLIPKKIPVLVNNQLLLFDDQYARKGTDPALRSYLQQFSWVKGDITAGGKYQQVILKQGIALDLFTAEKNNWGYILTLHTGSGNFNHYSLIPKLKANGYKMDQGWIKRNGDVIFTPEEEDLFRIAGLDYIPPEYRLN